MDEPSIVQNTYNHVAQAYTDRYGDSPFLLTHLQKFMQKMPKDASILDVGCGSGRATKHLLAAGYHVTSIDFSDAMLALAAKNIPNGDFRKMDIRYLDFSDQSFDALWATFSIIHIPQREVVATLRQWYRMLKPGGMMFIATSLGDDTEGLRDEWLQEGLQIFFNHMSKATFENVLREAGFVIEEINTTEDTPENEGLAILFAYVKK